MLKKSLLLMLLMAFMAPWAAKGQETLTVCDGSESGTTTTTNVYAPVNSYYTDTQGTTVEFIIPAETEGMSDMAGGTISKVTFYTSWGSTTPASWGTPTIQLYMGEVSGTTLSSLTGPTGFTVVSTKVWDNTLAEIEVELDDPYTYEGGNLLIGTYVKTKSGWKATNFAGITAPSGSSRYNNGSGNGTALQFLPQTTFTYTQGAPATCPRPTTLTASDITAASATLSFKENGSATSWVLQYGTDSDFGSGTYTEVTTEFNTEASPTITKAVSDLDDLTKYYVRVKSICNPGTDESEWSSIIDFTTKQNPVVVGDGWSDDFENSSCGWQLINGTVTQANWYWGTAEHNGEGSHSIYITNDNGATCSYNVSGYARVYATKLLTFANGKYTFQFDWKCKGETTSYDYLSVGLLPASTVISADNNSSGNLPTGWISVHDATYLNGVTTWQTSPEKTVQLEAGTYYFVLRWRQDNSGPNSSPFPAAVDNVSITRVACDYDVTGLEVEDDPAPTAHTATINWDNSEAPQWQVAWSKDNSFPAANTQTKTVNTYTTNLENLDASSTYYVRARAYCGGTDYGQWCNAINFDTECEIITSFPWEEKFETYASGTFSAPCWTNVKMESSTSTSTNLFKIYTYSMGSNTTHKLYAPSNNGLYVKFVLPEMDLSAGDYQFIIDVYRSTASSSYLDGIRVYASENDQIEGATQLGFLHRVVTETDGGVVTAGTTTGWYTYTFDIPSGKNRIILVGEGKGGNTTYVDNFIIRQTPDCDTPTGLAVTANSETPVGATITWTAGDASSWIVEYKKDTEDTWTAIDEPVLTPTYTFTNLDYSTDYNVRVKVNCTAGSGVTYPTDPVDLTTAIQYPAPKNLVISNVTDQSATLSWTPGYQETSWVVKYKKNADSEYTIAVPNPVTPNPTIDLIGLTGATAYDVQVYNSNNMETPLTQLNAFTTAFGVPFSETFATSSIPTAWNQHSALLTPEVLNGTTPLGTGGSWIFSSSILFGQYHARLNIFGENCKSWLLTPNIVMAANQSLSFDLALTDYDNTNGLDVPDGQADDKFVVLITTDNCATWSILRQWDNAGSAYVYNNIVTAGEEVYIDLAAYNGQTVRIAFYGESTVAKANEDNNLHIDNVSIDNTPTCYRPYAVTYSNVTNHSATISWTPGEVGQSAWQIAYKNAEFDPTDPALDWSTITLVNVNDNPTYTFDKTLDAGSNYYFYVRANCGTTTEPDYSAWSKKVCVIATEAATPAPTTFDKTDVGPDYVDLYWNAPAGDYLSGYGLYYSTSSTTPDPTEEALETINDPAAYTSEAPYRFTGLSANTTYYFWIRANHKANEYSSWKAITGAYFTTPEACPKPTSLVASEPTPNSIKLSWTAGAEWQTSWVIAYSKTTGFDPDDTDACDYVAADTNPFVVPSLDSETTYYFRVKGDCDTYGESAWNLTEVSETTLVACPAPTDILASNLTQVSADITWTGYSDSYTLQYRTAAGYDVDNTEDFSSVDAASYNDDTYYLPEGWKSYNSSTSGYNPRVSNSSKYTWISMDGNYILITFNADGQYAYAIMPRYSNLASMSFKYKYEDTDQGTLTIGYVTDNTGFDTYQELQTPDKTATVTNYSLTSESIATINAVNGYIAFRLEGNGSTYYSVGIDDIAITAGEYHAEGAWMYADPTNITFVTLENLLAGRKYEVQIQGTCGSTPSELSDTYTFNTLAEGNKVFTNATADGNWGTGGNWVPSGVPALTDNVIIRANATIESTCVAQADNITFEGSTTPTLTIADGGQLKTNTDNLTVTVEKTITKHNGDNGGWRFITTPLNDDTDPADVENMLPADIMSEEYDLFEFDATKVGTEWQNYKRGYFTTMYPGNGYLYANAATKTLRFTGTTWASNNSMLTMDVTYNSTSTAPFNGWILVGNPFVCNGYLVYKDSEVTSVQEANFYVMNADGNGYTLSETEVALPPCEGAFIAITSEVSGKIAYYTENPLSSKARTGILNINLAQNGKEVDMARIRFGEGISLGHMSFRDNTSMVYIPQNDEDYAVVYTEAHGEIPLNFKAETAGRYTISFKLDGANIGYLHLIDKATGEDINLLTNPEYSFIGSPRDAEDRFIVKFSEASENGTFIYQSGDELIVSGEGTLQVFDVMGRFVGNYEVNGTKRINAEQFSNAVYIFRLVGETVKTQKIVVR